MLKERFPQLETPLNRLLILIECDCDVDDIKYMAEKVKRVIHKDE